MKAFLNKLFSKKEDWNLEELSKDEFYNKKWLEPFFVLVLNKPKDYSKKEFDQYIIDLQDEVLSYVIGETIVLKKGIVIKSINEDILKSLSTKTYDFEELPQKYRRSLQYTNPDKNTKYMLIRFPTITKNKLKRGAVLEYVNPEEKREYTFSPIQIIKISKVLISIEKVLNITTGVKSHDTATSTTGVGKDMIIDVFDGIRFLNYSLIDRSKLYQKNPELDKDIFGSSFEDFCNWIIGKEKDSEAMKRNSERVRKILKQVKQ